MTATDELRRMLDERGVKWEKGASLTSLYTYWTDCNGHDVTAVGTDSVMFMSHFVTPAQAIEATLGPETCHDAAGEKMSFFSCSACGGTDMSKNPEFCHWCGRKVKQ